MWISQAAVHRRTWLMLGVPFFAGLSFQRYIAHIYLDVCKLHIGKKFKMSKMNAQMTRFNWTVYKGNCQILLFDIQYFDHPRKEIGIVFVCSYLLIVRNQMLFIGPNNKCSFFAFFRQFLSMTWDQKTENGEIAFLLYFIFYFIVWLT